MSSVSSLPGLVVAFFLGSSTFSDMMTGTVTGCRTRRATMTAKNELIWERLRTFQGLAADCAAWHVSMYFPSLGQHLKLGQPRGLRFTLTDWHVEAEGQSARMPYATFEAHIGCGDLITLSTVLPLNRTFCQ